MSSDPSAPDSELKIPAEAGEALIRGEVSPARFLNIPREQLFDFARVAHSLLQAGKTQQALDIFQGLVAASPMEAVFQAQLGAAYMSLEPPNLDEAFKAYENALAVNSTLVDALVGRGEIHLRRDNIPEGLADLSKAIKFDPEMKKASTQRAHGTLLALSKQAQDVRASKSPAPAAKK